MLHLVLLILGDHRPDLRMEVECLVDLGAVLGQGKGRDKGKGEEGMEEEGGMGMMLPGEDTVEGGINKMGMDMLVDMGIKIRMDGVILIGR